MNRIGTAREALVAEAIGDAGRLLDRVEAIQPALRESTQALIAAQSVLADRLDDFEARITALTEKSKVVAVKHILSRTDEAARRSVQAQTRAMTDAAQALFRDEVNPALQRLAAPLHALVQRVDRPWEQWLTHAATAVVSAGGTWALLTWL